MLPFYSPIWANSPQVFTKPKYWIGVNNIFYAGQRFSKIVMSRMLNAMKAKPNCIPNIYQEGCTPL